MVKLKKFNNIDDALEKIKKNKKLNLRGIQKTKARAFKTYMTSVIYNGLDSKSTYDSFEIVSGLRSVYREERELLNYIMNHIDQINLDAALSVLNRINMANDEANELYSKSIDSISSSNPSDNSDSIKHPKLITSLDYRKDVLSLTTNLDDIKSLLNFEDEFWTWISDRYRCRFFDIDSCLAERVACAYPIYDGDSKIIDIMLYVPKVVNYNTALIAIKYFKRAYQIYSSIGLSTVMGMDYQLEDTQEQYKNSLRLKAEKKHIR